MTTQDDSTTQPTTAPRRISNASGAILDDSKPDPTIWQPSNALPATLEQALGGSGA